MIIDQVKNIAVYKGINDNLDLAIDFIQKTDLESLGEGRRAISGDDVYLNIVKATSRISERQKYEYHKFYADIQILLSGSERLEYARTEDIIVSDEYNSIKDVCKVNAKTLSVNLLKSGEFGLFFPYELHKPLGSIDGTEYEILKAVIKVRMEK